jgi:hypothetical protein
MANNKESIWKGQYKPQLRKLKKLGLYTGEIPKGFVSTRQQNLVDQYTDVLKGRAKVIKVPDAGKFTSKKAREQRARELAKSMPTVVRKSGDKLIVRASREDERIRVDAKTGQLVSTHTNKRGEKITTAYIQAGEKLPELQSGESYGLPFSRGTDGIEYMFRATEEEMLALINEYQAGDRKNPYRDALGYVVIRTNSAYKARTRNKVAYKVPKDAPARKPAPRKSPRRSARTSRGK